jgi:hypothetical protein
MRRFPFLPHLRRTSRGRVIVVVVSEVVVVGKGKEDRR